MVLKVSFLVVELNLRNFKPFYKSYTAIPFPKYLYGELGICDYICKWVVLIFFFKTSVVVTLSFISTVKHVYINGGNLYYYLFRCACGPMVIIWFVLAS